MSNLYALLMAADRYLPNQLPEGSYGSLNGCVRDVRKVEDFLRRRLALADNHLIELTSTNTGMGEPPEPAEQRPTYENMVRAFQRLTALAKQGDQVYIHYSGHGGRAKTLLPEVKGPLALDEALVPIDIGSSSVRYLRDVELAKLLQVMVDKGLVVTVVLDCCHSGGATRGPDAGVRGVDFVDSTPRPTQSLVAPLEELRAVWLGPSQAAPASAVTRNLAGLARPLGYVLLAACRPNEKAYEYPFDGLEKNGALTYWLLNALQQLSPDLTYHTVYQRVLAKVHSQFELQTPLLQGDPGRVVFGADRIQPEFATLVLNADAAAKRVTLATGQAAGVRKGAQFVTYPRGTTDLSRADRRTALVEVDQLGATASGAKIVQNFGGNLVEAGDQAVLLGAASLKLVRKARLLRADGSPAGQHPALQAVRQALPGNGWVELTEAADEPADFVVAPSADGQTYEICDKAGQVINLRPLLPTADPAAGAAVVRRLVHLTKYRATQELDNNDSASPLKGKLVAELLSLPDDFDPADKPQPRPFAEPGPLTLKPGQWVCLRIANRSSQVLNVTVLDLQPDWGISQVFPLEQNADFEPLDPNREPLLLSLQAGLPAGYAQGADVLKVLATVGATSLRGLTLPSLDRPAQAKGLRSASADPLQQLLDALAAEQPPTRTLTPSATPSREWAVAQVEVGIRAIPSP